MFVVGASGIIGQTVARELEPRHEILRASRSSRDLRLDIREPVPFARAAFSFAMSVEGVRTEQGFRFV